MRAMFANHAALQMSLGHNIANANVEGYSRQSVLAGHVAAGAVHRRRLSSARVWTSPR
jgi:flagellar hook-associated protein FlgK